MAKRANDTLKGSIYGTWQMDCGVWGIRTRNVFCYLIVGDSSAMLVDTAYGQGNLMEAIRKITDLPVICVNTHTHYDHSGGNALFEEVWAGPGGEKDAVRKKSLPHPSYALRILCDGQVFDLGGRSVTCIPIGAHHPASFAFLDEKGRNLIAGDELDPCQVLLNLRGDTARKDLLEMHRNNMLKIMSLSDRFDRILPSHNGTPLDKSYLEDFLALSEGMLEGKIQPCETVTGFGWSPLIFGGNRKLERYSCGKASFICRKERNL